MRRLAAYWYAGVILAAGLAIVLWIALAGSGGVTALAWAGGVLGVLAGMVIAWLNGRKQPAPPPDRRKGR